MRPLAVTLLSLVFFGCSEPPPEAPYMPPEPDLPALPSVAPATAWESVGRRQRLHVTGQPSWIANAIAQSDGAVHVSFMGAWPPGTTASIGEVSARLPGETLLEAPLFDALGDVPVFRMDPAEPSSPEDIIVTPGQPLSIRLDNGVELSVELPPMELRYSVLGAAMEHAVEHGLAFHEEGAHEGAHSIYRLEPNRSDSVIGDATTAREIDWIARVEVEVAPDGDGRTCSFVSGGALPLELETDTVTVIDRRTGDTLHERVFPPTGVGCPTWAFNGHAIGAPTAAVGAWLEELVGE